jgi:RimJ/RimL family protein N-acetyltransferase
VSTWPSPAEITTERLILEPLRVEHADELAPALDDLRLHEFIGGQPATADELRRRYALQAVGHSPDGRQGWLNWIARHRQTGAPVGTVQATLNPGVAEVAWVIGVAHQRQGYAREAAAALAGWLRALGGYTLIAHIHPEHHASIAVAKRIGLRPSDVMVDGERRWTDEAEAS